MGCCTGRCFLITLCVLQFVATVERQVFDFLGYMWAPIIANFLQIIFVIVGFFGALQYRPRVVVVYTVWMLVWIGWNVFVICFYLEVGFLHRDLPILNLGTGNKSWWLDNGIGCTVGNVTDSASSVGNSLTRRDVPDESDVSGCLLQYYYVEVIHAGVQILLGLLGFCVACYVTCRFSEEDDSSQPVHDELEYIKMRYRSPARNSFRTNKAYETLTPHGDQTAEHNYSDDSADRYLQKHGDKQCVIRDGSGRGGWVQNTYIDPVTGQTRIPDTPPTQPQSQHDTAFNISGHTPGLTVV